jgi:hypothetical protein
MHTHMPATPEVRDRTARILLTIVLVVSIINLLMLGYMFVVVQHAANSVNDLGF